MTTDDQLRALGILRARFESCASRYPSLSFRLIEAMGDSRRGVLDPPGRPTNKSEYGAQAQERYSYISPNSHRNQPWRLGSNPLVNEEYWQAYFYCNGRDAFDAFARFAQDALTILGGLPIPMPIPPRVVLRMAEAHPGATSILPEWDENPAFSFAHAVNWIARSKVQTVLNVETKSWHRGLKFSGDPDKFRSYAEAMSVPDSPLRWAFAEIRQPLERFFSDIPDIFMASVWAIEWMSSQLPTRENDRDSKLLTSEAVAVGSEASPILKVEPTGKLLNPGSKALAAALQLKREGKCVSLLAACKLARVDRKNVAKRYPDFVRAIRALAIPDRTPRLGTIDQRSGNLDAIDEDL